MLVTLLKSKIHRAEVTDSSLHYEGSLGIDGELLDMVGIRPFEKILVGNINNGERFETYAIPVARGSRSIVLNGAAARKGAVGDRLVILCWCQVSEAEADGHESRRITLSDRNTTITRK